MAKSKQFYGLWGGQIVLAIGFLVSFFASFSKSHRTQSIVAAVIFLAALIFWAVYMMVKAPFGSEELAKLASDNQNVVRVNVAGTYQTVTAEAAKAAADSIPAVDRHSAIKTLKEEKKPVPAFLEALNKQYVAKLPLGQTVEYGTSITVPATVSAYRRARR
jgi:cytoskeletal protein RodZ